jgi:hypothetical protein
MSCCKSSEDNRLCKCRPSQKSVHLKNVDKFFEKRPEMLKRISDGGSVKITVSCLDKRYEVIFMKNETIAVCDFIAPTKFKFYEGYSNGEIKKAIGRTKLNPADSLTPSVGAGVAIDRCDAARMSHFYSLINESVLTAKNVRKETHLFITKSVKGFPPKKST